MTLNIRLVFDKNNNKKKYNIKANQMYLPSGVLVSGQTVGWKPAPFTWKWSSRRAGGRLGFAGRWPTLGSGFLRGATSDVLLWLGSSGLGNDWGFFSRCCRIWFWRNSPVSFTFLAFSVSLTGGWGSSLGPTRWEGGGLGNSPWGLWLNLLGSELGFSGSTGFRAAGGSLLRTSPLSDVSGKWPPVWGLE